MRTRDAIWKFDKLALKVQRRLKGYTLTQLEKISGVSFSYISKLERGDVETPGRDVVEALAKALDLSISDLVMISLPADVRGSSGELSNG